jgi:hypothetical protein
MLILEIMAIVGNKIYEERRQREGDSIRPLVCRIVVGFFSVSALVGLVAHSSAQRDAMQAEYENGPAIKISVADLSARYYSNLVKAEEELAGQPLEVSGPVRSVSRTAENVPYVYLGEGDATVFANFPEERAHSLAALSKHEIVTVRCIIVGSLQKTPILGDCRLL